VPKPVVIGTLSLKKTPPRHQDTKKNSNLAFAVLGALASWR
jgi:hypothetical protein